MVKKEGDHYGVDSCRQDILFVVSCYSARVQLKRILYILFAERPLYIMRFVMDTALKVPERNNFSLVFFTPSEHIWLCD